MHRNICCHTEEIVFTGTNLCVYKASQLYYIIVYKASPLEGKQEKGKAKKKKKKVAEHFCSAFGTRTAASRKEGYPFSLEGIIKLYEHVAESCSLNRNFALLIKSIELIYPI